MNRLSAKLLALTLLLSAALTGWLGSIQPAVAATVNICNKIDTVNITPGGKTYVVQNNIWNDVDGSQCLSVDDQTGNYTVTSANHNKPTNGAPAAYPSVFKGCHWGNCTNNSGMPVQVSALTSATTSWTTTQPGSGIYDVAYDIWFNTTPTTTGQPNGAELMIWLSFQGSIQPVGSKIASAVSLDGATWDVWEGNTGWNVISYVRNTHTTSANNLNIVAFKNDAVSRGYIQNAWYLITVEAGFEPWQGGAGLASSGFSVTIGGGGPTNTPTNTPVASNTPTNTPVPSNTPTNTLVPSPTPTNTTCACPTPTRTNTPIASNTPTNTPVVTNTPTNTPVPGGNPCSTPTVITGGGSYSVSTSGTCFKYVNAGFLRGGMWSVMNGSDATVSNTVKWYGGRNETVTNCINDTQTLNGNGAQINNFTVAKDSNSAMYVTVTGNKVNTVSISIQNWQNGSGCSVAPTPGP